jgi:hypothetical protein
MDISFVEAEDPDTYPDKETMLEQGKLFMSKIGGLDPWEKECIDESFLFQVHETPVGFNFAGMSASIYRKVSGEIYVELH